MSQDRATRPEWISDQQLDRHLRTDVAPEDFSALLERARQGDHDAALLLQDVETFREVLNSGPSEREQREWTAIEPMLRRRVERAGFDTVAPTPAPRSMPAAVRSAYAIAAMLCVAFIGLWLTRSELRLGAWSVPLPGGDSVEVEAMPMSPPPMLRGEPSPQALWEQASLEYESGRFGAARVTLAQIQRRTPDQDEAWLYGGIAALRDGDPTAAQQQLLEARRLADGADLPTGAIDWHLALTALELGDVTAAEQRAEAAAASGGRYAEPAARLLNALR